MGQLGPYSLGRDLGSGLMGPRWRATHPETGAPVTVHMLVENDGVHPEGWRRLLESLPVLKDVQHPNFLSVLDVVEENGVKAVVEEASDGPSLESLLNAESPPGQDTLLSILAAISKALSHEMLGDIVHLRVHPRCIFVEEDSAGHPLARLGDFALSRIIGATARPGHDSPSDAAYLAPEQWHPLLPVGPRTDVYALGVLMYRALTGRLPFDGPSAAAIGELHCTQVAPAPQQLDSQLPWQLDTAIRLAMTRHPADRLRDCGTLSMVLEAYLHDALVRPSPTRSRPEPIAAGSDGASMDTGVVHISDIQGNPTAGDRRRTQVALDATVDAEIPQSLRGVDLFGEEDRLGPADMGLEATTDADIPQGLRGVDLSAPPKRPGDDLGFAKTTEADIHQSLRGVDLSTPSPSPGDDLGFAKTTEADIHQSLRGVDLSDSKAPPPPQPEMATTDDVGVPQALWGVDLSPEAHVRKPAPRIGLENTTDPAIPAPLRNVELGPSGPGGKAEVDSTATTDNVSVPDSLQGVDLSAPEAPAQADDNLGTAETAGIDVGSAFQSVDLSTPDDQNIALGETESHVTPRSLLGLDLSIPEDEDED